MDNRKIIKWLKKLVLSVSTVVLYAWYLTLIVGIIMLFFGEWIFNQIPSHVRKQERIEYYDSLRMAKEDSTVYYKLDSLFILYNPKDTLAFRTYIQEHEIIEQLTALNYHDTIYLSVDHLPILYGVEDYSMYNPVEDEMFRIIINTDNYRLKSSFVRFDSIQVMNWPNRPFHLIYLDMLSESSAGPFIKEAKEIWNHLYYDSIQ